MTTTKINQLASLRVNIGTQLGSGEGYVTAGPAWAKVKSDTLLSADTAPAVFAQSGTSSSLNKTGWVAGLGYSMPIASAWSVRAEYLHYSFNGVNDTVTIPNCNNGPCGGNLRGHNLSTDVLQAGISYKF